MMKRLIRGGLAATVLLAFAACDAMDTTEPGARTDLGDPPLGAVLVDGTTGGNPYAFILSPVGSDPDPSLLGVFDDDVQPTVELCEPLAGSDTGCAVYVTVNDGSGDPAQWTVDGGPGNDVVTVDADEELYQTQIRFGLFDLNVDQLYRVRVRVDQNVLVAADLMLTSGGNGNAGGNGKGKGATGGGSTVPPDTYLIASANSTMPFKFRLDDGALCWNPNDPSVVSCTSITVESGDATTIVLQTSTGDQVVFDLPDGWVGDVSGEGIVDDITLTIEEVPTTQLNGETTCFVNYQLGDTQFGNPERCYDVRADTDTQTDVDVDFSGATPPVLAFCPDPDVLSAILGGNDDFLMTSVNVDGTNEIARVYPNVAAPSAFPGCSTQTATADTRAGRMLAAAWGAVRPAVEPFLPQPLGAAADLGFGGQIYQLSTIFFWSRLPESIAISPSTLTLTASGATAQLSVDEVFHHGVSPNPNIVAVQWISADPQVATVDANGLVTAVSQGTTQITATSTNVQGFNGQYMTASMTVTVQAAIFLNFTGVLGGPNGGPAAVDCPAGQVGVGMVGTAVNYFGWATFSNVGLKCQAIDAYGQTSGPITVIGAFGDGTGSISNPVPFTETCSAGSYLADLQIGVNQYVGSIAAGCYDLNQIMQQQVGSVTAMSAFSVTSSSGVQPSTVQSGTCSPGHVVTGIGAMAGQIVDALAFRCLPLQDVMPPVVIFQP